jgi:hypothetical protein
MNRLAKNSLVQAAALAVGWVLVSSFAGQTATPKIETRHPDLAVSQAFEIVDQTAPAARHETGASKGDLQVKQANCTGQAWPYIPAECLTGASRQASRTITIEKRTGETASTLIRVKAEQQVAAR